MFGFNDFGESDFLPEFMPGQKITPEYYRMNKSDSPKSPPAKKLDQYV
ncbi:MAG: hypothetical protein LBU34_12790 [Planctomycetaceae bacterium]|nr:hypothetical protein [Planctomycetaceae bacterium]